MTTINERIAKLRTPPGMEASLHADGSGATWISGIGEGFKKDWSGSIADAWELVEDEDLGPIFVHGGEWYCGFDGGSCEMCAPTAPEAIALAWLAVNGVE